MSVDVAPSPPHIPDCRLQDEVTSTTSSSAPSSDASQTDDYKSAAALHKRDSSLLPEALHKRDSSPLPEALHKRDASPLPEALHKRDFSPLPEALHKRDSSPLPEALHKRDSSPLPEALHKRDFSPLPEALQKRDSSLLPEALHKRDSSPLPEALHKRDSSLLPEALHKRDSSPLPEALHKRDSSPLPEAFHKRDSSPLPELVAPDIPADAGVALLSSQPTPAGEPDTTRGDLSVSGAGLTPVCVTPVIVAPVSVAGPMPDDMMSASAGGLTLDASVNMDTVATPVVVMPSAGVISAVSSQGEVAVPPLAVPTITPSPSGDVPMSMVVRIVIFWFSFYSQMKHAVRFQYRIGKS